MQVVQLSQRQIALQRIIRAQQSKIAELEARPEQTENAQQRKLQTDLRELALKLQHKDKQLAQLKEEQKRYRLDLRESREMMRQSTLLEKDSLTNENRTLQTRIKQLEEKHKVETERIDSDLSRMLKANQGLQKQIAYYKTVIGSIELQIQKLQIFYRSALVELPKRVQTLQWVQNLLKFINQFEQALDKSTPNFGVPRITKELTDFKNDFGQKIQELSTISKLSSQEANKLKEELDSVSKTIQDECKRISKENDIFWTEISKEKTLRQQNESKSHDEEIKSMKAQLQKLQSEHLTKVQTLEHEKKELKIALQQLKSIFEKRDRSYQDEIRVLKQSSEKLMEMSQDRQKALQEQSQALTKAVEDLTMRYNNHVRIPFEQFNKRFLTQFRVIEDMLTGNGWKEKSTYLLGKLEARCKDAQSILDSIGERQKSHKQVLVGHIGLLDALDKNITSNIQLIQDMLQAHSGEHGAAPGILLEDNFDRYLDRVELIELEQRKNYEIALLKKNNIKLQEVNLKLQALLDRKQNQQTDSSVDASMLRAKLDIKEQELSASQELCKKYQHRFMTDLVKIRFGKFDRQVVSVIAQNLTRHESSIMELKDYCSGVIMPSILSQNQRITEYMKDINGSIREIRNFLEDPIRQLSKLKESQHKLGVPPVVELSTMSHHMSDRTDRPDRSNEMKSVFAEFRRILSDRDKLKIDTTKQINELVQTLKNTLITSKPIAKKEEGHKSPVKSKAAISQMQRRVRDLQLARIKQKQEMAAQVDKLIKEFKKAQTMRMRADHVLSALNRTEAYLKEKVQNVIGMLEHPQKAKQILGMGDLNGITKKAIEDLESKLQETILESEGLLKEFKLLSNFSKAIKEQPRP